MRDFDPARNPADSYLMRAAGLCLNRAGRTAFIEAPTRDARVRILRDALDWTDAGDERLEQALTALQRAEELMDGA